MNLTSRIALLRRLVDSVWGARANTLLPPVWCRSDYSSLIDTTINDDLGIVIGCLRPTPMEYLTILAGIRLS